MDFINNNKYLKKIPKDKLGLIAGILLLVYQLFNITDIFKNVISLYGILQISLIALAIVLIVGKNNHKTISITLGIATGIYCLIFINTLEWIPHIIKYPYGFFSYTIPIAIEFISILLLTILSFKKNNTTLKKLVLFPTALEVIRSIYIIIMELSFGSWFSLSWILPFILDSVFFAIILLFISMYLIKDEINYQENQTKLKNKSTSNPDIDGYYDLGMHVVLLLFLGFIWQWIWIHKMTKYLNKTPGEAQRNPTNKLLLCIFVPFYTIYWTYQSAKRIDILAKNKKIESDLATVSLILAIFVPIIPPILMQSKINKIASLKNDTPQATQGATKEESSEDVSVKLGVADEIMKYKQLLDSGVISEEEFEAKKKQLLDL
jgi:hypothetical protein